MSLVDVKGVNLIPGYMARASQDFYSSSITIDADGELCGSVFEIPEDGNITKIGFRTGLITISDTLKLSLQTVDEGTGRPTGTLIHVNAWGTRASLSSYTRYWVSLQNPVAVTRNNTPIAVVVEFNSYVAGNLQITNAIGGSFVAMFPYSFRYTGGAWTLSPTTPNFGLKYDNDVIEPIINVLPAISASNANWDTNDNPDRRGLRFSVPYNCRLSGVFVSLDFDGDADIEIYNSDGITIIPNGTISLDANLRGSTGTSFIHRNLITPIELAKDTSYRIAIHPTTGTNIKLYFLDVTDDGAAKAMNAIDGGVNFHYTTCHGSPVNEASWTQTLTRRPLIGLMIDQLESADYPAESIVATGTSFNNATQTGTFARTTVTGAIVKGQSTVGIVVGE